MNYFDINIVNYKSTEHLVRCLESIEISLNGKSANILIQDNASEDNMARLQDEFPHVNLILNRKNLGFAKAVNRNLRHCRSPYIILINPDTLVTESFFEMVLEYMENHTDVGVLGPRILNHDGSVQESARSFPSPLTGLFGRTSFFTRWFPGNSISRNNLLTLKSDGFSPMEVDWVSGACMVVRNQAVNTVGPMDERFFMYWEDADWCRRMWRNGWKVIYYPLPTIIHFVGRSSAQKPIRSTLEFHISSFRLYSKYAKGLSMIAMPVAIFGLSLRMIVVFIARCITKHSNT